jgi:hypothetical protein
MLTCFYVFFITSFLPQSTPRYAVVDRQDSLPCCCRVDSAVGPLGDSRLKTILDMISSAIDSSIPFIIDPRHQTLGIAARLIPKFPIASMSLVDEKHKISI